MYIASYAGPSCHFEGGRGLGMRLDSVCLPVICLKLAVGSVEMHHSKYWDNAYHYGGNSIKGGCSYMYIASYAGHSYHFRVVRV